jgi:hypothetical protein
MIENIPTPLVSFAGSSVAGFFMGMFLRRMLKFLVIIIGSFLGSSHRYTMMNHTYLLQVTESGNLSLDKDIPFGEQWPEQSRSQRSGSQYAGPGLFQQKLLPR